MSKLIFHRVPENKIPSTLLTNRRLLRLISIKNLDAFEHDTRLKFFIKKGIKCVTCPREGYYIMLTLEWSGGITKRVFSKDFVEMTRDHIHAKSLGGSNDYGNLQTMCEHCNSAKSNKPSFTAEDAKKIRKKTPRQAVSYDKPPQKAYNSPISDTQIEEYKRMTEEKMRRVLG